MPPTVRQVQLGLAFLWAIVDAHAPLHDVFASVDQDVVSSNEDNCGCALANAWNALDKATKFDCVGLAPEFFVLKVDEKVAHFHVGASVSVEDGVENFARELLTRSLMHREWAAGDVVVNMDAC